MCIIINWILITLPPGNQDSTFACASLDLSPRFSIFSSFIFASISSTSLPNPCSNPFFFFSFSSFQFLSSNFSFPLYLSFLYCLYPLHSQASEGNRQTSFRRPFHLPHHILSNVACYQLPTGLKVRLIGSLDKWIIGANRKSSIYPKL